MDWWTRREGIDSRIYDAIQPVFFYNDVWINLRCDTQGGQRKKICIKDPKRGGESKRNVSPGHGSCPTCALSSMISGGRVNHWPKKNKRQKWTNLQNIFMWNLNGWWRIWIADIGLQLAGYVFYSSYPEVEQRTNEGDGQTKKIRPNSGKVIEF